MRTPAFIKFSPSYVTKTNSLIFYPTHILPINPKALCHSLCNPDLFASIRDGAPPCTLYFSN